MQPELLRQFNDVQQRLARMETLERTYIVITGPTPGVVLTVPATGTVPLGTGVANRVAYWSGTNTLTSDADLTYDGATLTAIRGSAQLVAATTVSNVVKSDGTTLQNIPLKLTADGGVILFSAPNSSMWLFSARTDTWLHGANMYHDGTNYRGDSQFRRSIGLEWGSSSTTAASAFLRIIQAPNPTASGDTITPVEMFRIYSGQTTFYNTILDIDTQADATQGQIRIGNIATNYFRLIYAGATSSQLDHFGATAANWVLQGRPGDGTSDSLISFQRNTDTTGTVALQGYIGDNTATLNWRLGCNVDTYFCADNGDVGIGTSANPPAKLYVLSNTGAQLRLETTNNAINGTIEFKDGSAGQQRFLAMNFLNSANTAKGQIAYLNDGTDANQYMRFLTAGTERIRILGTGEVGIGSTAPASMLETLLNNATTNATDDVITIVHNSTGTPTANFGGGLRFTLKSSTTADQDAMLIEAMWSTATHASRKAFAKFHVYDTAARECIRIAASGSAAMIGFLGASAIVRPAAYTLTGSATRTMPTDPSGAYTGINNAQAGTVYATVADLNTLRAVVSSLLGVERQHLVDMGAGGAGYGLLQ